MANPLLTSALNLANFTADGVWQKAIKSGALARLAGQDPEIRVGSTDFFTFTTTPKAELVGEGANKASADGTPTKVTSKTYKVQLTYRVSDEILIADREHQIRLIEALRGRIGTGISRALDSIAIYGINPATGAVSANVANYFLKTGNGVDHQVPGSGSTPTSLIKGAAGALAGAGYNATGLAVDPAFVNALANETEGSDSNRPLYPELGLGFNIESFQGLRAASSDTVSGKNELASNYSGKVANAIMGDFNAFKWAIAEQVPLHLIQYGDPDGAGDLQRTNEVAIRAEAYIGFAIMDGAAFSVIEKASA